MKIRSAVFAFIFLFLQSFSAQALDADYTAYLRGGTGTNTEGGKQECFYNSGIPGNFLRLGNECSFYTELAFVFNHLKPTPQEPLYFRTQIRIEYQAEGTRQWEAAANRDINQLEAFVQAGGFSEFPGSLWVGKRFYRDVDVHIFDWYYYADMSGVGAGWDDIPLGPGEFALAHLIQADDAVTDSSVGRPVLQAIDLRWKNVVLNATNKINFWGVYAWAPRGTDKNGTEYIKTDGYSLSTKLNSQFAGGNNNLALMYGKGAMKDLNIYGSSTVQATDDKQNRASTWRLVNDFTHDVSDHWALMLAFAANKSDTGAAKIISYNGKRSVCGRFILSRDRFQWAFEGGFSRIKDDSQKDANGNSLGERTLSRITIAPQISMSKSIWGRPVMRAFISHSFWNDANKTYIAGSAPAFADRTEGTSFGYQFEVWF